MCIFYKNLILSLQTTVLVLIYKQVNITDCNKLIWSMSFDKNDLYFTRHLFVKLAFSEQMHVAKKQHYFGRWVLFSIKRRLKNQPSFIFGIYDFIIK